MCIARVDAVEQTWSKETRIQKRKISITANLKKKKSKENDKMMLNLSQPAYLKPFKV